MKEVRIALILSGIVKSLQFLQEKFYTHLIYFAELKLPHISYFVYTTPVIGYTCLHHLSIGESSNFWQLTLYANT